MVIERKSEQCLGDLFFPEGARWFQDRLWFGDLQSARVSAIKDNNEVELIAQFESPCSGIGFLPGGDVVVSLMKERVLARVNLTGQKSTHADLAHLGFDHINDIITDRLGRTYVDGLTYNMTWLGQETHRGTAIHRFRNNAAEMPPSVTDQIALVEPDGTSRCVAKDLLGPNGLAISGDGKYLIVAEWRANRLTRFRISEDGSLTDRELFAETPGLPDGICVDVEDAVWIASPTTGDCIRVLKGGHIVERVKPVGKRVTACVLGGADRRTLFLTTDEMPNVGVGRIEMVKVDVAGAGFP